MNAMVSVIIPVYNSQQYLEKCLDSILEQTYTNYEVIIIDDGSTDKSGLICDRYAKVDCRIRVIHQENKGAAAARNKGILSSSGQYLMFCDSDDRVSSVWIERLVSLMNNEDVFPIGAFCYSMEELGTEKQLSVASKQKLAVADYFSFKQAGIAGYVSNALYCRNTIIENGIMFREKKNNGDFNEDLLFSLTYVRKVKKIIYTGYMDYMYNVHTDSLSKRYQQYYFDKYKEKYKLWGQFINDFCLNKKNKQVALATEFLYHVMASLQMDVDQSENNSWKRYFCHFKQIVCSSEVSECLTVADTEKENTFAIFAIKHHLCAILWGYYKLVKVKQKIKNVQF